ncbi:hypothetical protein MKW92_015323 [Papaver armeniacum]|nr:hypothetical protein MKW92_015323 [Papaver armeniacum]
MQTILSPEVFLFGGDGSSEFVRLLMKNLKSISGILPGTSEPGIIMSDTKFWHTRYIGGQQKKKIHRKASYSTFEEGHEGNKAEQLV